MKILFVSAVLPYPLYSGGQIRIYNLVKALSRKHDITLYSFIRDEKENEYKKELSFCKKVETVWRGRAWQAPYILRSVFGTYPLLLSTYDNGVMREKLTETLRTTHYDLIHIEPGYVWPSIPHAGIPLITAEHNIEHTIYEEYIKRFPVVPLRPVLWGDVVKLRFWEQHIWRQSSAVITVSDDDREVVEKSIDAKKVAVVPNGVDLASFPFSLKKKTQEAPVFLFVGNFLWMQNQEAVQFLIVRLWPSIQARFPKATIRIVGKNMSASLKRQLTHGMLLLEHIDKIIDEYKQADILLAPIHIGGGTKFKILEAMASGLPVITTTQGAKGLKVSHGKELMVADDVAKTVDAATLLLADTKKRGEITKAARTCIEEHYAWEHIANVLDCVWKKTV